MATQAQFGAYPRNTITILGSSNANRNGTGVLNTVFTANITNQLGSRVDDIYITALGTTSAGQIRLYISDGVNHNLWQELLVTAITPSTTISPWSASLVNQALVLANGFSLRASTNVGGTNPTDTFHVVVTRAADF